LRDQENQDQKKQIEELQDQIKKNEIKDKISQKKLEIELINKDEEIAKCRQE